jgi:hypothetical protein
LTETKGIDAFGERQNTGAPDVCGKNHCQGKLWRMGLMKFLRGDVVSKVRFDRRKRIAYPCCSLGDDFARTIRDERTPLLRIRIEVEIGRGGFFKCGWVKIFLQ